MIVRISSEGQYRLDSSLLDRLNEMDNALVEEIADCNAEEFTERFKAMLELVRHEGVPVEAEELVESDVILPRPEITVEEARAFFTGEGLVPDHPAGQHPSPHE